MGALARTYDDDDSYPAPSSPPINFDGSRSFNSSDHNQNDSQTNLIHTPPPGVSPDRLAIRRISPQRSPLPVNFRRSISPQHNLQSSPLVFFRNNNDFGERRMFPKREPPRQPGPWPRPLRAPIQPAFAEFAPRGPRPFPRPYYEREVTWTPGMPTGIPDDMEPRDIRSPFELPAESSWRREEKWRSSEGPSFFPPVVEHPSTPHNYLSPVLMPSPHEPVTPAYIHSPADDQIVRPKKVDPWFGYALFVCLLGLMYFFI